MAIFSYTPHRDFIPELLFEVSRQNLSGFSSVLKFGRNTSVDSGPIEDIWDGGALWSAPTEAAGHDIRSTNASDTGTTGSGAGARTVDVQGLDASYDLASEIVTLNGTTNVGTTGSYIRVFRMVVRSAGSDGINHGNITACMPSDDTVTAQVSASFNQTLMANYTIPASHTGYITNYYGSMNRNNTTGAANVFLKVFPFGETLQTKHVLGVVGAGNSSFNHPFSLPLRVVEKSDIRIQADASSNSTDVSAGFDVILVAASQA